MKLIATICIVILFINPAIAQQDSASIKKSIQKEITDLQQTLSSLQQRVATLEESIRACDTLIFLVEKKQREVLEEQKNASQLLVEHRNLADETEIVVKKLKKDSDSIKLGIKNRQLSEGEKRDVTQKLRALDDQISGGIRNIKGLEHNIRDISIHMEKGKTDYDRAAKEFDLIKSKRNDGKQDLDKARNLITRIEDQIRELKQLLDK